MIDQDKATVAFWIAWSSLVVAALQTWQSEVLRWGALLIAFISISYWYIGVMVESIKYNRESHDDP